MEHLAPLRLLRARAGTCRRAGREPSLDALHADDVRVPPRQWAAGRRAEHAARHAEHDADEPRLSPGLGRVDQRLRSARVEVVGVGAVSTVLCVEVSDRVVAGGAGGEMGVEASRRRGSDVAPARVAPRSARAAGRPRRVAAAALRARRPGTGEGGARGRATSPEESVFWPGFSVQSTAAGAAGVAEGTPTRPTARPPRSSENETCSGHQGDRWKVLRRPSGWTASICVRGCSSMVEPQPSKLITRVRFPPPASVPRSAPCSVVVAWDAFGVCDALASVGESYHGSREAGACRSFSATRRGEVLVVLRARPAAAPAPADRVERSHERVALGGHPGTERRPPDVRATRRV